MGNSDDRVAIVGPRDEASFGRRLRPQQQQQQTASAATLETKSHGIRRQRRTSHKRIAKERKAARYGPPCDFVQLMTPV